MVPLRYYKIKGLSEKVRLQIFYMNFIPDLDIIRPHSSDTISLRFKALLVKSYHTRRLLGPLDGLNFPLILLATVTEF